MRHAVHVCAILFFSANDYSYELQNTVFAEKAHTVSVAAIHECQILSIPVCLHQSVKARAILGVI